jgi:putative lipoic acid-binding regulatory protein
MDIPKEESLIKYPCHFPIKIVGLYSSHYKEMVIGLVREYAPDVSDELVKERYSKNKKYLSLSIIVNAQSREQLDAIYCALTACKQVSWVL